MTLGLDTMTMDCADTMSVARFWSAALRFPLDEDSDQDGAYVADPSGRTRGMFFQPVPEPKAVKNRTHLDVRPTMTMAEEVDRLHGLGATTFRFVEEGQRYWTVMQDVEGNEFCLD
jgi:hypothetical protein